MASFATKVTTTYFTFVGANWLSNFILHPTEKLDYGFVNEFIGREVNNKWWGTKTAHILTIALPLAVIDHASIALWNNKLLSKFGYARGTLLSFAGTPGPFLIHGCTFAFAGIMSYVAWDSMANPNHKGKRWEAFISKAYPELRGCHTMWMLPLFTAATAAVVKRPVPHGTLFGLVPPTLAFTTVKGFGMTDWGKLSLTPFERKLNGLDKK